MGFLGSQLETTPDVDGFPRACIQYLFRMLSFKTMLSGYDVEGGCIMYYNV